MKKSIIITLFLCLLMIGSVSAASDNDTLSSDVTDDSISQTDNNEVSQVDNEIDNTKVGSSDNKPIKEDYKETSFKSLNKTINEATTDTIELKHDYIYDESSDSEFTNGITISKSITIDGNGKTIDANKQARIFNVINGANIIIKNLKFTQGQGKNVYYEEFQFGDKAGGAICANNCKITIINSTFTQNKAPYGENSGGGAIYALSNCNITITDSQFIDNIAYYGGAIYLMDSNIIIINSQVTQNTNADYGGKGGAIYAKSGTVTITSSQFTHNKATSHGGAICVDGDASVIITINNSTFTNNTANYGGAINSEEYDIFLNNCSFENCYAQYGGAIYTSNSNLDIIDSQFINNAAYNYGGAIVYEDGGNINIQRTKFINDSCIDDAGGAIYLKCATLNANYVNFTSCNATFGGAITTLKTDTQLDNIILNNNTAKYEGGAIYQIYGNLLINNSNLSNNNARNGGAIYSILSKNITITNNAFNNNQANGYGKSIYSIANQNATIENNSFNYNIVANGELYEITDTIRLIYSGNHTLYHVNVTDEELPSKYDLRDYNQVTAVKNQSNSGNCWAFDAIGALESAILKAGGDPLDLSEENIKNLMTLYSLYGWNLETNKGGYDDMGIGYLTSWLGPINDVEDKYNEFSTLSPLINSTLHIQNIAFFNRTSYTDNDAIKQSIMNYGAVATAMYYHNSYLKGKSYYYSGSSGSNHAVIIVGWDDNYSRYNFKKTPASDGAWIAKNSWGTDWGDNGYFYVSYYDTKFVEINKSEASYVIILNDTLKYDKNYQYDIPGKTDYFLNSTNTAWYKNIFNSTDNEYLAAVSTYFQKDTNWTLTIKVNNILKYTQDGFSKPGYYTINLNQMIPLNIGDIFEVIFKIKVDGEAGIPISEKTRFNNLFYKENISFLSNDGLNWIDFYQLNWTYPDHTYSSQVACIKAFTILNPINTTLKIGITNITETNSDVTVSVYNQYGYLVNSGNVTFTIGDNKQTQPVINGIAKLNIVMPDDIININVEFNAIGYNTTTAFKSIAIPTNPNAENNENNNNQNPTTTSTTESSNTISYKTNKQTIKIIASKKTFKSKVKVKKYTVTLKNKNKPIKKATVKLTIKGKKYTVRTNNKGKAIFKINLKKKGKYTAVIIYKRIKRTVKIIVK